MRVLILTVFWYHAPAITTQEFTSEQTCQVALQQAEKGLSTSVSVLQGVKGVCVKK